LSCVIRDAGDRSPAASVSTRAARLVREPLASTVEPLVAARWLRGEPRAVALSGAWAGGGLLMSSHPAAIAGRDEDPLALLGSIASLEIENADIAGNTIVVGGGWFGWLGFELARRIEPVTPPPPRPEPMPPFDLAYHDHLIRCDAEGRWWFEALWTQERESVLSERLATWRARLAGPAPATAEIAAGPLRVAAPGTRGHAAAVAEAIQRIANGEVFQANICLRLEGAIDGDLLDLWLRAASDLEPSYAAYVAGEQHAVASLSPELFLRRRDRSVETRPIKGTAPRSTRPEALAASAKDRAENVMIVDLMRNDLGRVCEYGSVRASGLWEVEPAAGVWHLVSTVRGTLRADAGDTELLRATFPPGSVTGAPKVQVLRVIHQLESTAREVYCGAIGLCSPLAGLELNVAIRTFERREGRLWLGVGGGVVSDSSPQGEVQEALAKARGVALAAGVEVDENAQLSGGPARAGNIVVGDRPDPTQGVFETILVRGGRPVDLAAHLSRLRASGAALGIAVPDGVEKAIESAAAERNSGGVRILLDGTGVRVSTRPLPATGTTALCPVVLPGGLGAHKWADRALVDSLSGPGSTPLLCDLDGHVLEAGYAAVAIVEDDTLLVPPLDGRILPSVSRARLLATAGAAGMGVRIASFTVEQMRAADAILLSSSLRGPHPGALPGAPATELARELSTRLGATR
jgi:para-aminobenzoate synthetase/4-amino-4-deoxychorismate lyase